MGIVGIVGVRFLMSQAIGALREVEPNVAQGDGGITILSRDILKE